MPSVCRSTRVAFLAVAALLPLVAVAAVPAHAQRAGRGAASAPAMAPAREASQFDFLVGQWELEVRPKVNSLAARIHGAPKLLGSWKAWKVMDGFAVEDELRILDRSGNPSALVHSVRQWIASERRWAVTGHDAYRARVSNESSTWDGKVMLVRGTGDAPQSLTRTRFSAITPTSFHWEQDRSDDGGRTWNDKALVIDARRVSATAPR